MFQGFMSSAWLDILIWILETLFMLFWFSEYPINLKNSCRKAEETSVCRFLCGKKSVITRFPWNQLKDRDRDGMLCKMRKRVWIYLPLPPPKFLEKRSAKSCYKPHISRDRFWYKVIVVTGSNILRPVYSWEWVKSDFEKNAFSSFILFALTILKNIKELLI